MQLNFQKRLFYFLFLCYLAILPVSGTIALRNLFLLILVGFVLFIFVLNFVGRGSGVYFDIRQVPGVVVLWILFLFLFPFLARGDVEALDNIKGQWLGSTLAWIVGFGAVLLLGKRGPSLWILGLVSAFPLAIHLLLCLAAWAGFLSDDFYANPTITSVFSSFFDRSHESKDLMRFLVFPMGFRGIEPMHGNLGYAACQAIALFGISFYFAWRDRRFRGVILIGFCIFISFLSLFIAGSRGAILFGLVELLIIAFVCIFKCESAGSIGSEKKFKFFRYISGVGGVAVVTLVLVVAFQTVKKDERWTSMVDKVKIGFLSEEPINILCEGISEQMEEKVRNDFIDYSPSYVQVLLEGLREQDGARILLMRAGLDLLLENPWGLDGSRLSYQKLITEKCGHEPVLKFSHAHQGWIDLALALGWLGLIIFAAVLIYFSWVGWRFIEVVSVRSWAMALFLIGIFWMLRGFADSVYREHYLQMQALLLAYLYGRLVLELKISGEKFTLHKGV